MTLLLLTGNTAFAEVTKLVRMHLVDSITREPISGAHVTYSAEAREGTLSGHGGKTVQMFEIHAQSDADGLVTLQPTEFNPRVFGIFGLNTNYESPSITVVKAGYARMDLRSPSVMASPRIRDTLDTGFYRINIEMKRADAASDAREAEAAQLAETTRRLQNHESISLPESPPIKMIRKAPSPGRTIKDAAPPQE
ncbi:hypothetical protein [Variovorax paradoxus]|uniref:hypothetical protein n=1 Tax=Variovorax paradoxus TaxID=34073 RepID=UPI003D647A8C